MLSVIFVVSTLAVLKSQDGPASGSRDDGREAHALLARMKTSRDLLKSGTYRASGRLLTNRRSFGAQQPHGEVQIFSAFDLDKGLFRFDRTQEVEKRTRTATTAGPANLIAKLARRRINRPQAKWSRTIQTSCPMRRHDPEL
jgi:hypothetical protein